VLIASLTALNTRLFLKKRVRQEGQEAEEELFKVKAGENCRGKEKENDPLHTPERLILDKNGIPWKAPTKKINIYDKQQGFGPSAYLFDYLDGVLQQDVVTEFQAVYDAVKALTPDEKFHEPYPIEKLVQTLAPSITPSKKPEDPNDQALLDKLKAVLGQERKVFNEAAYKAGITVGNIHKALTEFKWNHNPTDKEYARKLVDRFDFDGDGRLNPREFILMSIIHNKNILGTTCTQCYNDVIKKKIDHIYQFLDCDNDGKITAEDVWEHLKDLKRPDDKYDIYDCTIKKKKYRTNSINDFFIKNMRKAFDGYLSPQTFRAAILLGYWDRQTDTEKIHTDDVRLFKQLRWGPDGDTDVVCQRILTANNPPLPKPSPIKTEATKEEEKEEKDEQDESRRFYN